jgi:hypothetical protein
MRCLYVLRPHSHFNTLMNWIAQLLRVHPPNFVFFEWMGPLVAFALTLLPILHIEKYLPSVYKAMNGKLS